jgi:Putative zinc-finger
MSDREPEGKEPCDSIRPLLTAHLEGSLDEARTGALRSHLADCPSCREKAAAVDPTMLFLELGATDLDAPFWRGFQEDLRRRIETRGLGWTGYFRYPAIAFVTAPLLMILMVGISLVVLRPGWRGWDRHQGLVSPYAQPPGRAENRPPTRPPGIAAGARGPGAPPPGSGEAARPVLEEVGSPGARVYHFTVGGPGDETAIYLVVDESINL